MFSRAAKDLLRNTISSVDHHNRVLEEQEMWRQWELEQGLTMMVSDEAIKAHCAPEEPSPSSGRKRPRSHSSSGDSSQGAKRSFHWTRQLAMAKEADPDRWGHSGYKELYPEEFRPSPPSSSCGGSDTKKRSKSHKKKRRYKQRHKHVCSKHKSKQSQDSDPEDLASEFLRERRKHKQQATPGSSSSSHRSRSRRRHRERNTPSSDSDASERKHHGHPSSSSSFSSDSELVWEERKT
ncbi:unnamed protein product [Ixodes pacificus]